MPLVVTDVHSTEKITHTGSNSIKCTIRFYIPLYHACSKPVAWKGAHCCGYGPNTGRLIKNPMMMMMMIVLQQYFSDFKLMKHCVEFC